MNTAIFGRGLWSALDTTVTVALLQGNNSTARWERKEILTRLDRFRRTRSAPLPPSLFWASIVCTISLLAFVFWEWNHSHPIIRLHLFKHRNFAVANVLMLVAFSSLFGSTVLIPLFAQTELGYTAQKAEEVLFPGG